MVVIRHLKENAMSIVTLYPAPSPAKRRSFLSGIGKVTLSATAIALLAGLDRFLGNPLKAVPGTKMAYAGVKEPTDRADLIAYLKWASQDPGLCE